MAHGNNVHPTHRYRLLFPKQFHFKTISRKFIILTRLDETKAKEIMIGFYFYS